jgi:AraC family transcriptional regulator
MSSTALAIPAGRTVEASSQPKTIEFLISSEERGWSELSISLVQGGLPDFHCWICPDTIVSFLLGGEPFVERKRRGGVVSCRFGPGAITIIPGGQEQAMRCTGSPLTMNWVIGARQLQEFAGQEFGVPGDKIVVQETLGEQDDVLRLLGDDLVTELRSPSPCGRLRAEGLQLRLLARLLLNHSSLRRGVELPRTPLSKRRLSAALDFIEGSLGEEELTLKRIAAEAGLSQFCFARSFRQEVGVPPHRYVLERRVLRARQLLGEPRRTITEVAYAVGFSSQSHLTKVFRGHVGLTPSGYREAIGCA